MFRRVCIFGHYGIKKVVDNSGDLDATVIYLYDGQKIIETRDGSGNLYQQFIHGTQYIDELVMVRVKDKGDLYVHQDANWNVIGLTDLGGSVVERHVKILRGASQRRSGVDGRYVRS